MVSKLRKIVDELRRQRQVDEAEKERLRAEVAELRSKLADPKPVEWVPPKKADAGTFKYNAVIGWARKGLIKKRQKRKGGGLLVDNDEVREFAAAKSGKRG
jgi:hypothetical protein